MKDENILSSIKVIINNIPDDVSTIEKLRWVYIKLGHLFSYDYSVVDNPEIINKKIDLESNINRYQTCIQISELFNEIVNNYIDGATSSLFERPTLNVRGTSLGHHVGNKVVLDTGEKYIMDLTIDLFFIQSGMRTTQFGYTQSEKFEEDIIPSIDLDIIDERLSLSPNQGYLNDKFNPIKNMIKEIEESNMYAKDKISLKISTIKRLLPYFKGYHEGKQFIGYLINELFINNTWHEYNLIYDEENYEMKTIFQIEQDNELFFFIYSPSVGIIETSLSKIKDMIENHNFNTRSETLLDLIYNKEKGINK